MSLAKGILLVQINDKMAELWGKVCVLDGLLLISNLWMLLGKMKYFPWMFVAKTGFDEEMAEI